MGVLFLGGYSDHPRSNLLYSLTVAIATPHMGCLNNIEEASSVSRQLYLCRGIPSFVQQISRSVIQGWQTNACRNQTVNIEEFTSKVGRGVHWRAGGQGAPQSTPHTVCTGRRDAVPPLLAQQEWNPHVIGTPDL